MIKSVGFIDSYPLIITDKNGQSPPFYSYDYVMPLSDPLNLIAFVAAHEQANPKIISPIPIRYHIRDP